MPRLLLSIFAGALLANAGTVTTSSSTTVYGAPSVCAATRTQPQLYCETFTGNSFANALATAASSSGFVSVSIGGSAWGMAEVAVAAASALLSLDFLISGPAGSGVLRYDVELTGHHSGVQGYAGSSVYFNGAEYAVSPSGTAVVHLTRTFEYGAPFTVDLSVSLRNSWSGFSGEAGSSFGSARLLGAHADPQIPEPSTIVLWLCSVVLLFIASLKRGGSKR